MKVTFVNRMVGIRRSGGGIWDLRMAEHLQEIGVEVNFCVAKSLTSKLPEPVTDFDCVEVPTPHLHDIAYASPPGVGGGLKVLDNWAFTRRAASALTHVETDIIQVTALPEFAPYANQFDTPTTIKLNGPPYSLWYDVINPRSSSYKLLEAFDRIITTGITTQKVTDRIDSEVETINPGVDTDQFTPNQTDESNDESILFVGRFVPAKNLSLLVEAFADILEEHPESELVLVGDGPLRDEIEEKIRSLQISKSVRLLGYIDNAQLPSHYREADIFALSSRHDNHPITLLEAMSCGTPVIAPRVGWVPKMIDHGENGLLYEPGDKEELVDGISTLLTDSTLRTRLGEGGRTKAVQGFDWEQRAKELKNIYKSII